LKEGCEWASSNLFTVEVITCGTITSTDPVGTVGTFEDPRDNKVYKIVMMPDGNQGKVWFAENLNYQKDLVFNQSADVANGVPYTTSENGTPAIGSFWCPAASGAVNSTDKNTCGVYGALYTWETAMMVDGKWADENKQSSTWDETWVSGNYFASGTAPAEGNNGNKNNARGDVGRGICPEGWHVPTDYEWAVLLDAVDDASTTYIYQTGLGYWGTDAGAKLKSASTFLGGDPANGAWLAHDHSGMDTYRFSVLPAGYVATTNRAFSTRSVACIPWSSTVLDPTYAWFRRFDYAYRDVQRYRTYRSFAASVRCILN
jgi:uncharacterized protein (TIGR02145 family)